MHFNGFQTIITTHVVCPATCVCWSPFLKSNTHPTHTEQNNLQSFFFAFFQKHLPLSVVSVVRYDIVIAAVQQRSE